MPALYQETTVILGLSKFTIHIALPSSLEEKKKNKKTREEKISWLGTSDAPQEQGKCTILEVFKHTLRGNLLFELARICEKRTIGADLQSLETHVVKF